MKLTISQQGELVKISPRVKRAIFKHHGDRGNREVTTRFTKRSRKNLLDKFAIIDKNKAKNATFVTLTYAKNMQNHKRALRDIRAFLKRVDYEYPQHNIFACWKKELQDRGAIHFHVMFWNLPFLAKELVSLWWGEITGDYTEMKCSDGTTHHEPPFTRIEYCKNRRKAWYYVSKYLGKMDDKHDSDKQEDASGFNIGSNLAKDQFEPQQKYSTGRWWGWHNRKNIPLAENVTVEIELTWAEYRRYRWDLMQLAPHTKQTHMSHRVKLYWFFDDICLVQTLLRGMMGERALMWERIA